MPAGALAGLQRRWPPGSGRTGAQWVDAGKPFGAFIYSTYTEDSYDAIWANFSYIPPDTWWFRQDFGKSNSSSAHPRRADTVPQARQIWLERVSARARCALLAGPGLCLPRGYPGSCGMPSSDIDNGTALGTA